MFSKHEPHLLFKDGAKIPMLSDFTIRVVKYEPAVRAVGASVINRGKHGKVHIDPTVVAPLAKAQFDLAAAAAQRPGARQVPRAAQGDGQCPGHPRESQLQ